MHVPLTGAILRRRRGHEDDISVPSHCLRSRWAEHCLLFGTLSLRAINRQSVTHHITTRAGNRSPHLLIMRHAPPGGEVGCANMYAMCSEQTTPQRDESRARVSMCVLVALPFIQPGVILAQPAANRSRVDLF